MRDEHHGQTLGLELGQRIEQLVDLLWDQDGGGLVEDEDARSAIEHLEDLHPLALTHPEVFDQRIGVDIEAVPF